ncbi:MAG: helix-hairpin-helix domain-containing protein [Hyphomicrobiales bacterium]|nr:helix-hairpin-helix domain-containing protein [Hyphomicrobiales bacterium]
MRAAKAETGTAPADGGWNGFIAEKLREAAALLAQQQANPFRVSAYRHAADTIAALDRDVAAIFEEDGEEGLEALPHIGRSLAAAIAEMVRTGRWSQLDRLRGTLDPVKAFQTVPGIGPELARRIHDHLHIDTLEALELAAHDGSLERVPGLGPRRAAIVRHALAAMLARRRPQLSGALPARPDVGLILDVDAEYRRKAKADTLPKIAPRRFNPTGTAWLPILHAQRGDWEFTALFSNTPLAHELGRTRDWVVIYFHTDNDPEGQCTVVTETRGSLEGQRVVRGREEECRRHYRQA